MPNLDRHRVTLGDYDILVELATAAGRRRSIGDLAAAVLLSPGGISRRVDSLEREGLRL